MNEVVKYEDVLRSAVHLAGITLSQLDSDDSVRWREWIEEELEEQWMMEKWPEFSVIEKRYFRDIYDNTKAYSAGDEVYYPKEEKYYQALRASTGNLPTDEAYWAVSQETYDAAEYDNTKAYAVGDQAWYPDTDKFYGCHTASTGNVPTDTNFWGELTVFLRQVIWEQTGKTAISQVLGAWKSDPRVTTSAEAVAFDEISTGVVILKNVTKVWLEIQTLPPSLFGDNYDATVAYSAGDQVYHAGDFWDASASTTAGENPTNTPSKWTKVKIPKVLRQPVAHAAYMRFLEMDGQHEKAAAHSRVVDRKLGQVLNRMFRTRGQVRRLAVLTR